MDYTAVTVDNRRTVDGISDLRQSADNLSVAILAGGQSKRMGRDKAFLTLGGRSFISRISDEMCTLTKDMFVVIGKKQTNEFRKALGRRATIIGDEYDLKNPMGGILSACKVVRTEYVAFLACDMPLVKSAVVLSLYRAAQGHSAAIPIWPNGFLEPLCAVYNVREAERAGLDALREGSVGAWSLISHLVDASYVRVESLRIVDHYLDSFININSVKDFKDLSRVDFTR